MGFFAAGVALVLFWGFLANRLGYLSVHKRAAKPANTGASVRSGPNGGERVRKHVE